jgi:hypothetical protein
MAIGDDVLVGQFIGFIEEPGLFGHGNHFAITVEEQYGKNNKSK